MLVKLFWKYYAFLFLVIVLSNGFLLFNPHSHPAVYYHTLMAFNIKYITAYLLNILNLALNTIACVLIFIYAFQTPVLYKAPYWLFYARFLSDLTGHSWEWQMIQASMAQGIFWGLLGLAALVLPIVPSYFPQWRLTFSQK